MFAFPLGLLLLVATPTAAAAESIRRPIGELIREAELRSPMVAGNAGSARSVRRHEAFSRALPDIPGVGAGFGAWDLVADRAYLATSPGGPEVSIPALGQRVYLQGDWFVDGAGPSGTYSLRARLDGVPYCLGSVALEAGGFTITCDDGWVATAGTHTLTWEIDYTNVVAESDETNNVTSRTWGAGLDIVAQRAFMRTAPNGGVEVEAPAAGQPVYVHVEIGVSGASRNIDASLRASIDGGSWCSGELPLQPGSNVVWCPAAWTGLPGTHTLAWIVDAGDAISEVDETNNLATASWQAPTQPTPDTPKPDTPTRSPTPVGTSPSPATSTPTSEATATRTPFPTPSGPLQGSFGRGDSDCSLTIAAADVTSAIRALAGESRCGNDDCDRDGVVSADDADCAARCIFGGCPVPDDAPRVVAVVPESALEVSPFSVARIVGESFGDDVAGKAVTIGNRFAEVVAYAAPEELLVIVPEVEPGPVEVVVLDGDVASAGFTTTIAPRGPVGEPDAFRDLLDLLDLAADAILGLDLEAIYDGNGAVVRREVEAFRDAFPAQIAALLDDPGFTAELESELDLLVDASGVPEMLADAVDALSEPPAATTLGPAAGVTLLTDLGRTVTSAARLTAVVGQAAGATSVTVAASSRGHARTAP